VPLSEADKAERAEAAASRPSKLALGTEGGFAVDGQKDYTLDKAAGLVVVQGGGQPRLRVPLPCPELPELVLNVITAIQVCC
jgi:ubiquitin carboxyl-terminal hydrolase 5/13